MYLKNITNIRRLLFENQSIRQTIFKNTFWLVAAEGVTKLFNLVFLIYIARVLGATQYGKFTFALAFIGLFTMLTNLGLPRIIVREFSQDHGREKDFSSLLSLRLVASVLAYGAIFIASFFVSQNSEIRRLIWILALYTLIDTFSAFLNFFFHARQKMEFEAFTKILRVGFIVGLGFFVIFNYPSVENLSFAYLTASFVSLVLILIFFHFKVYPLRFRLDILVWRRYLGISWPLIFAGLLISFYGQIDSVMMGYRGLITETGWYNAAYRIAGAASIPVGLISTSFYPIFNKSVTESSEHLKKVWFFQIHIMMALAFPVVVGGIITAPRLIEFFYGQSYAPSIFALRLLFIMVGISFFHGPLNQVLLAFHQEKKFFWISLAGAVVNGALNVLLIPKFTLYGAATASIATSLVVLFVLFWFVRRFTTISLFNSQFVLVGLLAVVAVGAMYGVITRSVLSHFHILISVSLGAIVYFAVFFSLQSILRKMRFPITWY